MKTITVRMDSQLLTAVDSARGEVPRERWIRRALEAALSGLLDPETAARITEANAPLLDRMGPLPAGESLVPVLKRHLPTCGCPVCKPVKS